MPPPTHKACSRAMQAAYKRTKPVQKHTLAHYDKLAVYLGSGK